MFFVVLVSDAAVGIVNAITMTCGFLTFGGNSAGMILNNYATKDFGAAFSRMLVAVSMIGGFPLLMMALRSATDDLLVGWRQQEQHNTNGAVSQSTSSAGSSGKVQFGLLASLTVLSMFVRDAGFVVGLNGAITGSAIIYSFPALLFLRLTRGHQHGNDKESDRIVVHRGERTLCRGLVGFGILSAVLGTFNALGF